MGKNAPTRPIWIVCLLLYIVAMLAQFGVVQIRGDIATWSWIIGFGLLLVATHLRRL